MVLICAFQPSYALIRIAAAVETFVNATRSRSNESIIVLSNRAEEIEHRLKRKCRYQGEYVDQKVFFVTGVPTSTRSLRVSFIYFSQRKLIPTISLINIHMMRRMLMFALLDVW